MKKLLPGLLLVLIAIALFFIWNSTRTVSFQAGKGENLDDPNAPQNCPEDIMTCPDGRYVGRTGPNCEFQC